MTRYFTFGAEDKKFYKRLMFLALPIVVQEFLNAFVVIVNTVLLGALGVSEIAAVGLGGQLFFLFSLICFGVSSGSSILMGQFWGDGDAGSIRKTMGLNFAGCFSAALVFTCIALCLPRQVMGVYSADNRVIELGVTYLRVIWVSYFFSAAAVTINLSLRSTGQTLLPMATGLVSIVSNVLLNYLFIRVLKKGVPGAATAAVIARALEVGTQLILINALKMPVVGKLRDYFASDVIFFRKYIKLVLPVILNEFAWALGTSLYNAAYRFCGTAAQAALYVAVSINGLFNVVGMGVGTACGIIMANTLGEGDGTKAVNYSRKSLLLVMCISLITGALMIISFPLSITFFDMPGDARNYAFRLIIILAAGLFFKSFNFMAIVGILRNGGDTVFCFLLDMSTVWFIGVPAAFIGAVAFGLPIYWVFALVQLEEVSKFFFCGKRALSNIWVKKLV